MDRGYVDFYRLYNFVLAGAFFVTRSKARLQFIHLESRPVAPATGVRSDHLVRLRHESSRKDYPAKLRLIHYVDPKTGKRFIFLTNNLVLPARTMALLYKKRWQVELFFKWIKQHLRIKRFYGTSENAVKTQIWIAICVYVLVAILKKQLQSDQSLHSLLQILSVNAFEQSPLHQVLTDFRPQNSESTICNQLEFRY
jgi:IS4 transposase